MTTVNAEAFVKDIYANSNDGNKDEAPQYVFDSKKEVELKRLNEQHHALMELQRDRLVHSSIDRPKRILDVRYSFIHHLYNSISFTTPVADIPVLHVLISSQIGCGTGLTTATIARKFPEAEVIGVDINPVPAMPETPKNVTFIQGRVEDIMASVISGQPSRGQDASLRSDTFGEASFDYIFARLLTCVISTWPELIKTCVSLLRPDGWLEMHEPAAYELFDESSRSKPLRTLPNYTYTWTDVLHTRSSALGYNMSIGKDLHAHFLEQGLNEVRSVHYPWVPYPWSTRPETERLGTYMLQFGPQGHPAILRMFTPNASNEERAEWERQIAEMCDPEKGGRGLHWRFYAVCGRKA